MSRSDPQLLIEQPSRNIPKRRVTHIIIPIEIWESDLPTTAKILLAEISSLEDPIRGCFAGNSYFAKFLRVTEIRVSQLIRELVEKGFIEYKTNKLDGRNNRGLSLKPDFKAALNQILHRYISSKEDIKSFIKTYSVEEPDAELLPKKTISTSEAAKLRAKKTADPAIERTVAYFKRRFKEEHKDTPTTSPRDYKAVKDQLRAGHTRNELEQLIDWCLTHAKDYPGKTGRLDLFMGAYAAWSITKNKGGEIKPGHVAKTGYVVKGDYSRVGSKM